MTTNQRKTRSKAKKLKTSASVARRSLRPLVGYIWSAPNSCFWDSSLELLFHAFLRLSKAQRNTLLKSIAYPKNKKSFLPTSPPLHRVIAHFLERCKWIEGSGRDYMKEEFGTEILKSGQELLRSLIFDRWDMGKHGEYGNAVSWTQKLTEV